MKVLLTGGTGFIGSHTCVEFIKAGISTVVVDNLYNSSELVIDRIEQITNVRPKFYKADILDSNALDKIFTENTIDTVIHFAGLKAVGESVEKPLFYHTNNVAGTINLCNAMQRANVKNIVFSSSCTVYGEPKTFPISEAFPTGAVTNPYAGSKYIVEQILQDLTLNKQDNEWSIVLLRYFNPVGAHESGLIGEDPTGIPNNLMPFITQVAVGKRERLNVFGNNYDTHDGTGIRDYIHVVDLARGHLLAAQKHLKTKGVSIYNLGTGKGYSVLDVVKAFEKATQKTIPYKIVESRAGDIACSYANPSKANNELGWKTEYDLNKMCIDSWNWQSKNPEGYKNQ